MSTLFRLIKFNMSYYIKPRFESKKERNKYIGLIAFTALCFLLPIAMLIAAVYMTTGYAMQIGVLAEFLSVLFMSAQISVMIIGITTYVNIVYFSKDNVLLASMPLRSSHIYISKVVVCLISMMMLSSLMIVPAVVASAVAMSRAGFIIGPAYYVGALFSIVYIPLLPLLVISLLAFPVMKIIAYLKRRPVLMAVTSALFAISVIILVWAGMFSMQGGSVDKMDPVAFANIIANIGKYSYSTLVLSRLMIGESAGVNIAILLGISIGSILLNVGMSVLLYKKTILTLSEGGMGKQGRNLTKTSKSMSSKLSLLMREVKVIMRTPDVFVQTIMMLLLAPILIVVFTLFGGGNSEGNTNLFFTCMVFFYISIVMGINYLATIAISREREKISLLKTLPVESKDIIKVKLYLADAVTLIGSIICSIAYVVCVKVPWYYAIFMLIVTIAYNTSINAYGIYRDAKKPNFKWMNTKEITKNNFGAIVPMLYAMIGGMVVMILGGVMSALPMEYYLQDIIVWSIMLVISIVYYFIFRFKRVDKIVKVFDMIEQ